MALLLPHTSPTTDFDNTLVTGVIQNMPNLRKLYLFTPRSLEQGSEDSVFQINSTSLKYLDVSEFTRRVRLSLDCPSLRLFYCAGRILQVEGGIEEVRVAQLVVEAVNIPDSCRGFLTQQDCGDVFKCKVIAVRPLPFFLGPQVRLVDP